MRKSVPFLLGVLFVFFNAVAQKPNYVADNLKQQLISVPAGKPDLFQVYQPNARELQALRREVRAAQIYSLRLENLLRARGRQDRVVEISLPLGAGQKMNLSLYKADIYTSGANILLASDVTTPWDYDRPINYWGIVNGDAQSLASITLSRSGVAGFIYSRGKTYNLGRLEGNGNLHVLYEESDMLLPNTMNCFADELMNSLPEEAGSNAMAGVSALAQSNCVNMYIEVDNSIVTGKGGVQEATDYVNGVFSQVALLYANENINWRVNELKVWNVADPYTGPSSSDYLNQFRANIGSNFNGNLAHLVGYGGGGGVAYLNVVCNKSYGHGYSGINSTYNHVPQYSWTVMVIAHEIGHNLGANHTHDCVWNGNNTPIDGCGTQAGYPGTGCSGMPAGPIPAKGTIMSYCHLLSGVGIDLSLGFGLQPGDRIRSRVYNASCLSSCPVSIINDAGISAIISPPSIVCASSVTPVVTLNNFGSSVLSGVTINYNLSGGTTQAYNWTGSLASGATTQVTLGSLNVTSGNYTITATTANPNGSADQNNGNNSSTASFTVQAMQTWYADADGDGYGNPAISKQACTQPAGYVANRTDCNDNNASIYPGAPCDDGNACTVNSRYDANCNCTGSFADSDNDGVCDAEDKCPGGDDRIDVNGNGIPDACECTPATTGFDQGSLSNNGTGSSSATLNLPAGAKDLRFTINGLNAKTDGNPKNRFADRVSITWKNGDGIIQTYGSFSGINTSSVNVNIPGMVQSVTVTLSNELNNGNSVAVSLLPVEYCSTGPCTDSDGDGVCDEADICPGGDDRIDSDGDGIPDFCDTAGCQAETYNFAVNPLTHQGTGQNQVAYVFAGVVANVQFSISGLNATVSGKPTLRFAEQVQVTYVDGNGLSQVYGIFSGANQSSVEVSITGNVQSVTVILRDGYSGNSGSNSMSVNLSAISACPLALVKLMPVASAAKAAGIPEISKSRVYPNPAQEQAIVDLGRFMPKAKIKVYTLAGRQVYTADATMQRFVKLPLQNMGLARQLLIISVQQDDGRIENLRLIIQ